MQRLDDKVALITGCASPNGIGFGIARLFASEGAHVFLSDIDEQAVTDRARELTVCGYDAHALKLDVTSEDGWMQTVNEIQTRFGRLDILVNNAGILIPAHLHEARLNDWSEQLEVNLLGTFLGTKHSADLMRQHRHGSIINISSVAGLIGVPSNGAYAATKGGIRLFSKCAAIELAAADIRVNTIHPGFITTDIQIAAQESMADDYQLMLDKVPMKRSGTVEDVAYCAVYLASDESRYVTGTEMVIDGGLTAS